MFKLIAILFLVTNGSVSDQPSHIMTFNHSSFDTEDSCMEFITTEDGRLATTALGLAALGQGVAVKFTCVQAQDNTI